MEEQDLILANDFCLHHRVELNFIYTLQEFGLMEIVKKEEDLYIPVQHLHELERMIRLHYDLNVNMEGIDVILHLLEKLQRTQEEVVRLRNQLKFYSGE